MWFFIGIRLQGLGFKVQGLGKQENTFKNHLGTGFLRLI